MNTVKNQVQATRIAIISHDLTSNGEYHNMTTDMDGLQIFKPKEPSREIATLEANHYMDDREMMADHANQLVMEKFVGTICLDDLDYIFIYFDNIEENKIIEQSKDLNPDKLAYIMCNCQWRQKMAIISAIGNNDARIIPCTCGGQHKLASIARQLLAGTDPHSII